MILYDDCICKPCTNCLGVALGLIFIITIIQRNEPWNVVHCVKVSPARQKKMKKKKICDALPHHLLSAFICS